MSGFIPMVSSSPPPMDDGGGFGWDDDDDEFGTFASADTSNSFKAVESPPTADWNQSNDNAQHDSPDFADFSAFESTDSSISAISQMDSAMNNFDNRPEFIPLSKDPAEKCDSVIEKGKEIKEEDTTYGPLTDSGMFSSEISPVPQIDESGTLNRKCEHSDSLDDVQNDSLSDNTDANTNTDNTSRNTVDTSKDVMNEVNADVGQMISAIDGNVTSKTVIVNENDNSSVLKENSKLQEIPPDKSSCQENIDDAKVCSDENKTSHSNDSIPVSDTEHSSKAAGTSDTKGDSGNEDRDGNECRKPSDTYSTANEIDNEDVHIVSATSGLKEEASDNVLFNGKKEQSELHSDDLSGKGSNISEREKYDEGNKDQDEQLDTNVEKYINDNVIPEAIRKFSESCTEDNESEKSPVEGGVSSESTFNGSESQTYHTTEQVECAEDEQQIEVGKCDPTNINEYLLKEDIEVKYSSGQSEHTENRIHEFGDFTGIDSNDCKNDTTVNESLDTIIPQTISHNTSQELSNVEIPAKSVPDSQNDKLGGYGNNLDKVCEKESMLSNCENDSSNKQENNDNRDDDFGDFNTSQSKSDIDSNMLKRNLGQSLDDDEFEDFSQFNTSQTDSDLVLRESEYPQNGSEPYCDLENVNNDIVEDKSNSNYEGSPKPDAETVLPGISKTDDNNDDEFGDFSDFSAATNTVIHSPDSGDKTEGFADFSAETTGNTDDDWAAFGEPKASFTGNIPEDEDDGWGDFDDEPSTSTPQPVKMSEEQQMSQVALQNMTKQEKLAFAVTSCFPDSEKLSSKFSMPVNALTDNDGHKSSTNPDVWVQIKSLQTSKEVSYQWSKSEWNSQLFTTLHIDTKNVLIGHKKAPVPIFAAGLTLLEPDKGSGGGAILKPSVLVDTTKTDAVNSHSQESIPPAQFDWTGSGLTNPLEANNKTLNLDFLIQDQSTKSSVLESEFLGPDSAPITKPSIQPLENILANLKTNSTFRPMNKDDDISSEAQKVVQSLPNLSFMKSRVLMFPIHME